MALGEQYRCSVLGCSHVGLVAAQLAHGICSVDDCDGPIQGTCALCGLQVCAPLHGALRDDERFTCSRCHWREKGEAPR
jgi:hypothetical protein